MVECACAYMEYVIHGWTDLSSRECEYAVAREMPISLRAYTSKLFGSSFFILISIKSTTLYRYSWISLSFSYIISLSPSYNVQSFEKLIYCHIGNPQGFNQKPITFARQLLALTNYPDMLDNPDIYKIFPSGMNMCTYFICS